MDNQAEALLTKYLQLLGRSAGKEMENIRAKMAWSLAQDLWEGLEKVPGTVEELISYLDRRLRVEFPFCEQLGLQEVTPEDIAVVIKGCAIKRANQDFMGNYQRSLCPVDPFLIFFLNRSYSQNVWLMENCATGDGCVMKFSLSQSCALR